MSDRDMGRLAAMTCPACGERLISLDTRGTADNAIRRRRECCACGLRVTTVEAIVSVGANRRGTARTAASREQVRRYHERRATEAATTCS